MANKTVLVTGAARRLGAATARYLHAQGMDIIIHYHHSRAAAETLSAELSALRRDSSWTLMADLRDPDAPRRVITDSLRYSGRLDALINNASVFYPTSLEQVTTAEWDAVVNINLRSAYFLIREALPHLRATQGSVINIADIFAERPKRDHSIYCITKAGLVMLTKALAVEVGPEIRVNAIAPGALLWPESIPDHIKTGTLAKTILKRKGSAIDIAKAIRYLILDADYVTGQVLTVDGGRTLFI
jgi:pteridine reductase